MNDGGLISFFQSGFYDEYWGWEFTEADSKETAQKCAALLEISEGHILDWCGGWGRISLHLAKKGFKITILDFVAAFLIRAEHIFEKNSISLNSGLTTIQADCRNTPAAIQADHAICTFNSIGFLSDQDQLKAFKSLHHALKEDGRVLIDSVNQHYIAEHLLSHMENRRPDGVQCITTNDFDASASTLVSNFKLVDNRGKCIAERDFRQRIYSPRELKNMLFSAGFEVTHMYGSFNRDPLSIDLPLIVCTAVKR